MPYTYPPPRPLPNAVVLSVPQAAVRLGVSVSTVRRLIDAGELPTVVIAQRLVRVPVDGVDAFLARQAS